MHGHSTNNQCLLLLLLGVALFMVMSSGRGRNKRVDTYDNVPPPNMESPDSLEEVATEMNKQTMTVPTMEPVSGNTMKPVSDPTNGQCGYSLLESSSNMPYKQGRADVTVEGPGFERSTGAPYHEELGGHVKSNMYLLDDGANGELSATNNMVSKSCCGAQWPVPFATNDDTVCGDTSEYVPNRSFGNNSYQDAGCVCTTKKQDRFLSNRGGNGSGFN
jgi:hypothetical protein